MFIPLKQRNGGYPYLPLQMYWSAIAVTISSKFSIPFPVVAKTLPVLGDALISVFIYLILSRNFDKKIGSIGSLLFALNPIPIFVSAFHGQFDSIPIVLVLISIYYIIRPIPAGLLFGLSILAKSWPVLFLPSLLEQQGKNKNILTFAMSTALIPSVAILFYILLFESSLPNVIKTAISYNHGIGVWGYSYLFRIITQIYDQNNLYGWFIQNARFITLGILIVVWLKFAYNQSLPKSLFVITLAFLSFTHAFSIQYLSWLIPFAILDNRIDKWLFRYTIAAFAYMFMAYHTLILDMKITNIMPWKTADHLIILTGIPVWLVSIGWFFQTIRSWKRNETL